MFRTFLPLALIGIFAGCAHPIGHFTVVTGQNVNGLDAISSSAGADAAKVSGESCRDFILFIPISSRPTFDGALASAIQKSKGANALRDVTVTRDGLFTLFYNKQCYEIEGTPIKLGK